MRHFRRDMTLGAKPRQLLLPPLGVAPSFSSADGGNTVTSPRHSRLGKLLPVTRQLASLLAATDSGVAVLAHAVRDNAQAASAALIPFTLR